MQYAWAAENRLALWLDGALDPASPLGAAPLGFPAPKYADALAAAGLAPWEQRRAMALSGPALPMGAAVGLRPPLASPEAPGEEPPPLGVFGLRRGTVPTYSPYVQERWELVEYVNSTVLDDVAQPVWRESSAAGGLADVYGLSRLSTSGGSENLAIADTYLEDGLGSVSAVLREGGAVAASLSYSPWGEEELATESLPGYGDRFERPHYGYNAEQSSPEGGLQYLRARWYDPSMGAFGSRDSLLGDAADPATLNRYAYAEGNPVASCDPTGHVTRRRSMASMIARRPLYSTRARNVSRKVAAAPSTVTGAFSHAIANMRKPPRTVTGSFSGVVAGRAARRRQAVESAPYASYPSRLGSSAVLSRGRRAAARRSSYRQAGGRAAAVRRQFCGTAERQRDYGITPVKGSAADVLHLGLGFAGQTPVLGEPFDFADGVISLLEGDALGAILSFGAMFTGPGAASGAAKTAGRLGKMASAAEEVSDLSRAAGGVDLSSGLVRQTAGIDDIVDGQAMTTSEALDLALDFLGPGYKDLGKGRFISSDGRRVVRMGDSDIAGHAPHYTPHINFEEMEDVAVPGRGVVSKVIDSSKRHVELSDE